MTMTLSISRSATMPALAIQVADFAEASVKYCALRDESGEGASTFPFGKLTLNGEVLEVSYNGKVWRKRMNAEQPWKEDNELLFNPYA